MSDLRRVVEHWQHLLGLSAVALGAHAVQALDLAPDDLVAHAQDLRVLVLVRL